jgi:hypothetical protein
LSFDLAFAIIMVLTIFSVLISYEETALASVENGRSLAALNIAADHFVGNINAFYNSLQYGGTADYTMELPARFLFNEPGEDFYEINYTLNISGSPTSIALNESTLRIDRDFGFEITDCSLRKYKGESITFTNCTIISGNLACTLCT